MSAADLWVRWSWKTPQNPGPKWHAGRCQSTNEVLTIRPEIGAVTFLDPASLLRRSGSVASHVVRPGRIATWSERRRAGDEDGARRALGNDALMPSALLAGASLEHLARIALG